VSSPALNTGPRVSGALAMPGLVSQIMRALAATLLSAAVLATAAAAAEIGAACVSSLDVTRDEPNTHCGGQFACVNSRCVPLLELGERCLLGGMLCFCLWCAGSRTAIGFCAAAVS
jgi:hypothetical protein